VSDVSALDPWTKKPFIYEPSKASYKLYSLGSDIEKGGVGTRLDFDGSWSVNEISNSIKKPYWGCNI